MNDIVKRGISAGKDPMGLAAAVLYTSCIKISEISLALLVCYYSSGDNWRIEGLYFNRSLIKNK